MSSLKINNLIPIIKSIINTTVFASTYQIKNTELSYVTFSNITNDSNFQMDPNNNIQIICGVSGTYNINFQMLPPQYQLYLFINNNDNSLYSGSNQFTEVKLNENDFFYFGVENSTKDTYTSSFIITTFESRYEANTNKIV